MMPNAQIRKGKKEVLPFLKVAVPASHREPSIMGDLANKDGGVFEYWNVGTTTEDLIELAKELKWPFPDDPDRLVGRSYQVPVCFVYRLNEKGRIRLVREYLDTASVIAQFE
jgi:hypothetical protein